MNAFPERPNPHSHSLIRWELKSSTGTAEGCLMVLLKGTTEVGQEGGSSAAGSLPNRDRSQICLTQTTTIKATMGNQQLKISVCPMIISALYVYQSVKV